MMRVTPILENLYQEDLYLIPAGNLIALDKNWDQLKDDEKTLLSKILSSVKVTLSSVQIIHSTKLDLNIISTYSPKRVIAFGLVYEAQRYEHFMRNNISIILADSLDRLDDVRKKQLWLALKNMFAI